MLKEKRDLKYAKIVQKNVRNWNKYRDWGWYQMYGHVRPRLKRTKMREDIARLQEQMANIEKVMREKDEEYEQLQKKLSEIEEEKKKLLEQLEAAKSGATTVEERFLKVKATKASLEKNLSDVNDRLTKQEEKTAEATFSVYLK